MKVYLLDIFPNIERWSRQLDLKTHILNKVWILIDEENDKKVTYRFLEEKHQIIISVDGQANFGSWRFLEDGTSLLIKTPDDASVFKHSFIDDTVLALKLESDRSEFVVFVNENASERLHDNTLNSIRNYLRDKVRLGISGDIIAGDKFSITYPKEHSAQIHISTSFNCKYFPELEEHIAIINEKIGFLKTKSQVAEILIAYCEKRSVPSKISKFNKEFLEHLNNQKFPIALIDKIFKAHQSNSNFTSEFKEYLILNIT
jgi:hypothetical protein